MVKRRKYRLKDGYVMVFRHNEDVVTLPPPPERTRKHYHRAHKFAVKLAKLLISILI